MSILKLQETLRETVKKTALEKFDIDLGQVPAEVPPKTELGDLAFPIAFELAKQIKLATGEKQNPRQIAEILKTSLESFDFVGKVEVAGPGYLNVFYNRAKFLAENSRNNFFKTVDENSPKVCVEHTSVNPNKAAHIGHVRNSVLGDTFVRILRANGKRVEVQNYIDNTGVQVADVVVGFVHLRKMDLAQIKQLEAGLEIPFDYYCWDLYTEVGKFYAENEENKKFRAETLHELEKGSGEIYELADYVATRNVECILRTMNRFDIRYDLLPRESEILHLHFWQKAFELMKERGVIHFENEGKNKGCWVMPFESHEGTDEHDADKILVRSNGTVTYTGKDIAYQMWKLGLLGLDFNYKLFQAYDDGKEVWITTAEQITDANAPSFGHSETVYNVIDTRQSYPQEVVKKGVATIFPDKGEAASVHLSYEMVALSPAAAEELGFELSDEDKQRTFVEMSGRKGLGVKADDLLDRLESDALREVENRHPDISNDEKQSIAHRIAVGALRYFLLKYTKNTVVVFDFKEALSFEGETGVYCQNAAVRFNSIFKKVAERFETGENELLEKSFGTIESENEEVARIFSSEIGHDLWSLVILASRLEEIIQQAAAVTEPAILAKYNFNLSKAMHLFHHNHRIISEENPVKRAVLIVIADLTRRALTAGLRTMGIEVPERM
ncbi:MAG: arginine--tRNA ligase [Acidobacteria bacterium]|nr:arginine--tRNA ligase [Acidobacteriota bacterium]